MFCKDVPKRIVALFTSLQLSLELLFNLQINSKKGFGKEKMKYDLIKSVFCWICSVIVNLLGGWDIWLASLVFLMATDIVVGIVKSILCKSDKSPSGGLSSQSMFRGGIKKILILILIAIGTALDEIIEPGNTFIRSSVAGYYIANEMISIFENIGACGVPLPEIFYKVLDILKKKL